MFRNAHHLVWIAVYFSLGELGNAAIANAQVVPDTTLPVNSLVTPQDNILQIDGGTQAGSNLFHSFQEFSLPTGSETFFNNAATVDNIITRVTGGNVSNIDGLIRANGTANLFLLNPNGIAFGPHARLDIGGSFVGSTADRVVFADGSFFSATDTAATPPLLTINVPIGLQFGTEPGGIQVEGGGNGLVDPKDRPLQRDMRNVGLQVSPERTLALVGGDIDLIGGNLTATGDVETPGGRIELGSVGGNQTVSLTPIAEGWALGYAGVGDFRDISFTGVPTSGAYVMQGASLDASGSRAGTIQLRGRSISVGDGSALLALTLGADSAPGDGIFVGASEGVEIRGAAPPRNTQLESVSSLLSTEVWLEAAGTGRNVTIETPHLQVADAAFVSTSTRGDGNGGHLTVNATDIYIVGGNLFARSDRKAGGNGGNITVNTDRLIMDALGLIEVSTESDRDAGSLTVNARESIELSDLAAIRANSGFNDPGLPVDKLSRGNGGDISINTPSLRVANGAHIAATAFGAGTAGNLTVRAGRIEVTGARRGNLNAVLSSRLEVQVNPQATGNGGNLEIYTDLLEVNDGGRISAVTQGQGRAGNLTVVAREIEISGSGENTPSQLIAAAEQPIPMFDLKFPNLAPRRTGSPGNIAIDAERLFVTDGGRISVRDERTRSGGLVSNVGNIDIRVADLRLLDGGEITTQALNEFDGGNIEIFANTVLLDNSRIDADAVRGSGGRVNVTARGILSDESLDRSITANSMLGIDGVVEIQTPDIDPSTGLFPLPETPIDPASIGQDACSRGSESWFVNSGAGGVPPTPSEALRGETTPMELLDFPSDLDGSPSVLHRDSQSVRTPRRLVEARGWFVDAEGRVILTANPPRIGRYDSDRSWQGQQSSCNFP